MAVVIAGLVGVFFGLALRPLVDAYLRFKTAQLYRDQSLDPSLDEASDLR